ncbi:MAG: alpha/beta hydrolase [Pseudomonadota bacterium]
MSLATVNPEFRDAFRHKFFPPIHIPAVLWLARRLVRFQSPGTVDGTSVENINIDGKPARIYRTEKPSSGAAVMIFHGGGLIGGAPELNDWWASWMALCLRAVVVSPSYSSALDNPAPAAIDDCFNAWEWLHGSAKSLGIDQDRTALAGVSAGGGLAACLSQRLRDENAPGPKALLMHYPMLDDRTCLRRDLDKHRHIMWNNQSNRVGWTHYLGQDLLGSDLVPHYTVAARCEDLSGLPPTWLGVGDIDLFYDEGCAYAVRLQDAGVPCHLEVVPGAPHGFDYFAKDHSIVERYQRNALFFVAKHLNVEAVC